MKWIILGLSLTSMTANAQLDLAALAKEAIKSFRQSDSAGATPAETLDRAERSGLIRADFKAYSVLVDCKDRAASMAWMDMTVDQSNVPRKRNFYYTAQLPQSCQPLSLRSFSGVHGGIKFQRGHLLGANSFDTSSSWMKQANYMVNTVPQVDRINMSGSWREVEKILECYRTKDYINESASLRVIAGPVWGNDESDDYFVKTHGVRTPTSMYKIAVFTNHGSTKTYAWIFPNTYRETRPAKSLIDGYLTTPSMIERKTGLADLRGLVPASDWNNRQSHSPKMPSFCDPS